MRKIRDRLIKNLLTQWKTKEENRKILSMFGKIFLNSNGRWEMGKQNRKILSVFSEKFPNPDGRKKRKTGKDQAKERFKTFLLAWW